ncbi:G0/G1 switch protein 2 [Cottoperca gobio]|uniref:G0/G1 switch protein 2 n=1 Tax=Cottoperca gobio TaxID=56716 RepID=A0A6J2Q3B3_COTGO|nr:G0/G1 switch protein 2-like [Cottoperca gobio]
METIGEIIPFAKEMLNQRPSRGMLKVYMLGSTMVMLGVVGGLMETVFLPFVKHETVEDAPEELIGEKNKKEKKQVLKSHTTLVCPEVEGAAELMIEVKAKHLVIARQRSSNRLHAS